MTAQPSAEASADRERNLIDRGLLPNPDGAYGETLIAGGQRTSPLLGHYERVMRELASEIDWLGDSGARKDSELASVARALSRAYGALAWLGEEFDFDDLTQRVISHAIDRWS